MSLYFSQAIAKVLEDSERSLVTEFTLYALAAPILADGSYRDEKVLRAPERWESPQMRKMIRTLAKRQILAPDEDFKKGVWRVVQSLTAASAEEAICLVDPFAYISHLSAMQRYGITDRSPEALHMTTAKRALWTRLREQRMREVLGEHWPLAGHPPPLIRIGFHDQVRRRNIVLHETRHPAATSELAGERARIASIGRVFVDMLDQPALCGGIAHVLDCFERHAEIWLADIIPAVDQFDSPIVKVRAGYILDEALGFRSSVIESWLGRAQRGGSRKLDPHAPYGANFSEKWMIALNV